MTSTEPSPATGPGAALGDALATEYGVIYGYGVVSAYILSDLNYLVSDAVRQHRDRRDRVITMMSDRAEAVPVAAAGYQLPLPVNNTTDAAQLALRMENDTAVAWRAVVEQAREPTDRQFATTALSHSAVLAARWNQMLGNWPITRAFPGGAE